MTKKPGFLKKPGFALTSRGILMRAKFEVLFFLALLGVTGMASVALAEHATIDLRVFHYDPGSGILKGESSSSADEEPPAGGVKPRPLMKVKAREPLVLQFYFTNTYPHGDLKDATVTYFVVKVRGPRQKTLPDLKDSVVQGTFGLTFKPKGKVGSRIAFTIDTPGFYLVRVQSGNTQSDHEHFSAIDLQVE
jgi:hypothetical protein